MAFEVSCLFCSVITRIYMTNLEVSKRVLRRGSIILEMFREILTMEIVIPTIMTLIVFNKIREYSSNLKAIQVFLSQSWYNLLQIIKGF